MKNNNQQIISKLSVRNMKVNKFRNMFAIAAIVLTSLLFSVTFTLTKGIINGMEQQVMRQVGTKVHGGFKDITKEQYDTLRLDPLISDESYNILFSCADNERLQKRSVELRYTEEKDFRWGMRELMEGTLPIEGKDVVLDTLTLDALGIQAKIGEPVTLSFQILDRHYEDTFRLCGYYKGDSMGMASEAFFSKEYVEEILAVNTKQQWKELSDQGITNGIGLIQMNIFLPDAGNIEGDIQKILQNNGYDKDEIDYGINWAYASTRTLEATSILLIVVVLLIILTAGYLMIYNIFYISIVNDIHFYGLLKTVGTTGKQIRRLIRKQGDRLSLIGIPLGVIAGWLLGNALLPLTLTEISGNIEMSFAVYPSVFLFSVVFSYVTIRISCYKPGIIASKISPIEAAKYQENSEFKKKQGKSKRKMSYFGMARRNLLRSKKKTIYVVASMSLGLILFMTVFNVIDSFSIDKYVGSMLGFADFFVTGARTTSSPSIADVEENLKGVEQELLNIKDLKTEHVGLADVKIKLADNITMERYKKACEAGLIKPYNENDRMTKKDIEDTLAGKEGITLSLYGFNYEVIKNLKVLEGTLDEEKYNSGDYIVLTKAVEEDTENVVLDMGGTIYEIGDKVAISGKDYEVLAFIEVPFELSKKMYSYNGMFGGMPYNVVEGIDSKNYFCTYGSMYQVPKESTQTVEKILENYTQHEDYSLVYLSKETVKKEFQELQKMIVIVGGFLCIFVGTIAVMNYINSTITGILTRKREIATLKSIGMEPPQLLRMFWFESGAYLLYAWVFAMAAGSLLSFGVIRPFCNNMTWLSYQFPLWIPFVSLLPLLALVILIPYLVCRKGSNDSIVELLREE